MTQLNCEAHAWMNSSVQKIMLVKIYCDLWYQLRECSEAIFDQLLFVTSKCQLPIASQTITKPSGLTSSRHLFCSHTCSLGRTQHGRWSLLHRALAKVFRGSQSIQLSRWLPHMPMSWCWLSAEGLAGALARAPLFLLANPCRGCFPVLTVGCWVPRVSILEDRKGSSFQFLKG